MKNFLKHNLLTIIISASTFVLAAIAIFTAVRLYQLRSKPVTPAAPASQPQAHEPENLITPCQSIALLLATESTPTSTSSPTTAPTATPTTAPTPTSTTTATATPASTPAPTSTSTASPIAQAPSTTAAPQATLPAAGAPLPTLLGLFAGSLLLIGALLLAL